MSHLLSEIGRQLQAFSRTRKAWILLIISVMFFEGCALTFQHVMGLKPCVMCIYERVAMLCIAISALLALLSPHNGIIRCLAIAGWGASAIKGLMLSLQHVDYQLNPSPFNTCDIFVSFPQWAPLNKWIPSIFEVHKECSEIVWKFFDMSMPQWLVNIFAVYIVIFSAVVLSEITSIRKKMKLQNSEGKLWDLRRLRRFSVYCLFIFPWLFLSEALKFQTLMSSDMPI